MITIIYHKNGRAVADAGAEKFVRNLKDSTSIMISTENVIHAARALVVEEGLEVEFIFNGKTVEHNEYGAIHDWPKDFCDFNGNWSFRILDEAMKKRKKTKKEEKCQKNKN